MLKPCMLKLFGLGLRPGDGVGACAGLGHVLEEAFTDVDGTSHHCVRQTLKACSNALKSISTTISYSEKSLTVF